MSNDLFDRLVTNISRALGQLDVAADKSSIEDLAGLIQLGMCAKMRTYHNLDHVFNLVDEESPYQTLAAVFHDLVYFQVDQGFQPEIRAIIAPFILEIAGLIELLDGPASGDQDYCLLLDTFGFRAGHNISPRSGLNEFLSALVMTKRLADLMDKGDLFSLMLCIEASIPFRDSVLTGEDHLSVLERRAIGINDKWDLGFSSDELVKRLKQAVIFANHDVDSFAETDVACYLETSWRLLPEMNATFQGIETYSVREYRKALELMEKSAARMNPDRVFHQYRGEPSDEAYHWMAAQARKNIATSLAYFQIMLTAQAILEALTEETGGDMQLFDLVGERGTPKVLSYSPDAPHPDSPFPSWIDPGSDLIRLLGDGRNQQMRCDMGISPFSRFLLLCLGPEQRGTILQDAKEMFGGRLSASGFLQLVPSTILSPIASACAGIALSRRDQLLLFVNP